MIFTEKTFKEFPSETWIFENQSGKKTQFEDKFNDGNALTRKINLINLEI